MTAIRLARWRLKLLITEVDRPTEVIGVIVLAVVVLAGLAAPLSGYVPGTDVDPGAAQLSPGAAHWLGTDHLGRDVFSRLLYACRSFVGPAALACAIAAAIGVPAGALAGFHGGWVEALLRYVTAVVASIPRFVFVLLVCTIYGDDLGWLALAAGVAYTPTLAEAVFVRIEGLRDDDYVMASRAYGVADWRILWVHLVLAASSRLIGRHLAILFGYFVVLETTLSYVGGFGVQEPTPSWGNMLVFEWGRGASLVTTLAPAAAIWLTVLAATWVADLFGEVRGE